jgi:alkaline phosphatase D
MSYLRYFTFVILFFSVTRLGLSIAAAQESADPPTANNTTSDWHQKDFWECLDKNASADSWEFVDGEIRLVRPQGGKGSIVSGPLPSNFELSFEWKIESRTNTGLKYRVRKFGSRHYGIEYQIIDDKPTDSGKGSTASIYDLFEPSPSKTLNPVGQWNSAKIIANGTNLQHFLNGKLVSSTATVGPVWDASFAVSKFWGLKGFGQPHTDDRIMLTDHGGRAAYRNFRFTALDGRQSSVDNTSSGPFLANGMRNSWADQTSIVLWTRTTRNQQMNTDGRKFRVISKGDANQLSKTNDAAHLLAAQLPEDAVLDDMFGACPGSEGEVRLTYFPELQRRTLKRTDWKRTTAAEDFTSQWKLEGLKPGTRYAAVVEARATAGKLPTAVIRGRFETAPAGNSQKNIKFCMTTCHDFIRRDDGLRGHRIYPAMAQINPDFVVHAGDIEYYDKPDPWAMTLELMRFKWARIFALPSNRQFYQNTTSYFLKDDHDTLKNDCSPGQMYGSVSFERGVQLFNREQFPSRDPRYQTVQWGKDLQVWFLEGRDFRSPNNLPDGPDKTILGVEQKNWLFETLDASEARFKLVFSPTPIVGPDRANKKDNHANVIFAHEGNELREKLALYDGLIVFCGDRHWQYASVDATTELWEFGCGPGSEKHQFGWKPGDERPVHRFLRVAGGFLSGEIKYTNKKSQLTLHHHKVNGEVVSEFQFPIKTDKAEPEEQQ